MWLLTIMRAVVYYYLFTVRLLLRVKRRPLTPAERPSSSPANRHVNSSPTASVCSGENSKATWRDLTAKVEHLVGSWWIKLILALAKSLDYLCVHVSASLVACQERESEDLISRREHEEEMQRMRLEVQQCKDFIHMQQQLLQVYYQYQTYTPKT